LARASGRSASPLPVRPLLARRRAIERIASLRREYLPALAGPLLGTVGLGVRPPHPLHAGARASALAEVHHARDHAMSAAWARDGEPDLTCALALVRREALGANWDGAWHPAHRIKAPTVSDHVEVGLGGKGTITARAMAVVLPPLG
jgi:hypothetical protein